MIRATEAEKQNQIATLRNLHLFRAERAEAALKELQSAAIHNENIFEVIMEAAKYCSLGQMTNAMFEVGGQYRRNM